MEITRSLAEHLARMRWEELPDAMRTKGRLALLDTLGSIWGGAAYASSPRMAREMVAAMGAGTGPATILGTGEATQAPWAALCNGVAAHALDMDDSHRYATGYHPGATVVPACLAVAEQTGASTEQLLEALAVGYEAGGRIGRAINPAHRYRGFHSTGTVGVFGAAAGVGKLLGFGADQMQMALGVAGSMAGGVFEFLKGLAPTKHLHAGHAAHAGVLAALLVEQGFTGPRSILEGEEGFFKAYTDEARPDEVIFGLGGRWELGASYFKPYAACGHAFGCIEAALNLRAQGLRPEQVATAEIFTYRAGAVLRDTAPRTFHQGEFSVPFLTALALVKGEVTVESVLSGLEDQRVLDLSQRSECAEDPAMTASFPKVRPALVRVTLSDGRTLENRVEIPRGMPEVPLPLESITGKFRGLVTPLLGAGPVAAVEEAVMSGTGPVSHLTRWKLLLRREIA